MDLSLDTPQWPDFHDWGQVPHHIREGLARYINVGCPVGGFLHAVLTNDLRDAVARADDMNLAALRHIMQWLYCQAPGGCSGSAARVQAWQAKGGWVNGAANG
jgi:hypothetical protein